MCAPTKDSLTGVKINSTIRGKPSMSRAASPRSMNALGDVVDLLVESRIKLDALENVLKEINPLLHERYLGEIASVKERKASQLKQALTADLKAKFSQV
jgi:hypothetical protein